MATQPDISAGQDARDRRPKQPDGCYPAGLPTSHPASTWHRGWLASGAVFALSTAFLLWAFRGEIAAAMAQWQNNPTFGYAYFILPITLYLLYRLRDRLTEMTPRAAPLALLPLAGVAAVWMLGELANVMVVKQLAFVGLWQILFLAIFGWQVTWACLFPLAYLYLAVPLGSEIIPYLQDVTAQIVVHLLRLSGMPVFIDGYYIEIPSGHFLVAEACSGLRFLIVSIALGFLIAYLFFTSWPRRILFVVISVIVPVVANGVRAYGIIMLAHLSDYKFAAGVDHVVYGFIFLSVVIAVLIGLASLMRDAPTAGASRPIRPSDSEPGKEHRGETSGARLLGQGVCATLALGGILLIQAWAAAAMAPPRGPLHAALQAPDLSPEWRLDPAALPAWQADFQATDATLSAVYRRDGRQLDLQIGYYAFQREGAEALSELNTLMAKDSGWQIIGQEPLSVTAGGGTLPVVEMLLRRDGETRLLWYWYAIGGETTNSRPIGKLLEMKSMVFGGERSAAIVAVSVDVAESKDNAAAVLRAAIAQSLETGRPLTEAPASLRDASATNS